MGDRLKRAREQSRRFDSARKAGQFFYPGTAGTTYMAHENGQNDYGPEEAARYAKVYRKSAGWLLTGEGPEEPPSADDAPDRRPVRLVGYVSAGSDAHFVPAGDLGEVDAEDLAVSPNTVAVEVRGNSLGRNWNGATVFYDHVEQRVTDNLVGSLVVAGLDDGRIVIKWLQKGSRRGRYHLVSDTEPPILDAKIVWAAKAKNVRPR